LRRWDGGRGPAVREGDVGDGRRRGDDTVGEGVNEAEARGLSHGDGVGVALGLVVGGAAG